MASERKDGRALEFVRALRAGVGGEKRLVSVIERTVESLDQETQVVFWSAFWTAYLAAQEGEG